MAYKQKEADPIMKVFLDRRLGKGLSRKQVEMRSGVNISSIADYERGRHSPSLYNLVLIGKAIDLKLIWIPYDLDFRLPLVEKNEQKLYGYIRDLSEELLHAAGQKEDIIWLLNWTAQRLQETQAKLNALQRGLDHA